MVLAIKYIGRLVIQQLIGKRTLYNIRGIRKGFGHIASGKRTPRILSKGMLEPIFGLF